MDAIDVAKKINLKIVDLEELKKDLPLLAQKKAETMAQYEKALAMETLQLSVNNSVGLVDKLAKGKCADLKMQADLAESMYRNALKIIDMTMAQLNALQSINRHLSEA